MQRMRWIAVCTALLVIGISTVTVAAKPVVPPWRLDLPWTSYSAIVTVGDIEIEAEIADTNALRSRGLSFRDGLEPGHGMIFIFDDASPRSFWMREMRFCLDIIWIENGEIVGAAEHACPEPGVADQDLQRYRSPEPVTYVLEMPAGWLDKNGFGVGTPVTIQTGA